MSEHTWVVMPVLAGPEMTEAAIGDLLAQTVPTRILIVNQGVETAFRERLERIAEEYPDRIVCWHHVPPLPSLSATWNRALRFVWETGGSEALVVNNDVRLHPRTIEGLRGAMSVPVLRDEPRNLFVSAVGVAEPEYKPDEEGPMYWYDYAKREVVSKGGPDFSCFLISREGHEKYPFDEAFTPAFCEDLDTHRRYMLGGDGDRIFSINLPYQHLKGGSQTLKSMSEAQRAVVEGGIARGSREHYRAKWGGDVNAERFSIPFDWRSDQDGITTPELQAGIASGSPVVPTVPAPSVLIT